MPVRPRLAPGKKHPELLITLIVGLVSIGLGSDAIAQEPTAEDSAPAGCSDCHNGTADAKPPGPPQELLAGSVHNGLDCTDCHESILMDELDAGSAKPHGERVQPVDCGQCHEEEAEVYQKHGRLEVGKDPDLPTCSNCHGTHEVLPSSDRQSHMHPINLPSTCRACHTNVDLVKKHTFLRDKPIKLYESSVHGKATRKGLYVAATCKDCHSSTTADGRRTAHRILSPADPESTIYHFSIPDTCGECHRYITQDYWDGIHGQLVKRGSVDAPVCTHCHGEHGIISPDDPRSPVSSARLAEETCAPCHESALLAEKYGLAGGRLASYIDSYHGLKSKAGDVRVANCASCHGVHRILPSTDPTSSIHADNLQATCGECHPAISSELAHTRIHETATGLHTGWPAFFRKFYIVFIAITIGLMLLHNVGNWVRRVKEMGKLPFVRRMSTNEVMQHWVLMLSFMVLVLTGFSLRFSEAWWVRMLFGWEGGFEVRGVVHRVAAVVMTTWAVWHVLFLLTSRGRQYLRDMLGSISDLGHIKENALYFLGLRRSEASYKRFSYMEKCEYWALIWGTVIMTITGVLLWFDDYFTEQWHLPKGVLDCTLVIHYYEAWLAFLAIVVWHIYGTVFSPSVYPMNPAWLSGKMPKDMYAHEHPEGPKLKARVKRIYAEEEEEEDQTEPPAGGADASPP